MDNKLNIFIKSKIKLLNSIKKGYYSKIGKGTRDFKIIQSKNNNLEFGNQLDILNYNSNKKYKKKYFFIAKSK